MSHCIAPAWQVPASVRALVTTRPFGDMARGSAARSRLAEVAGYPPVWLRQVHGVAVADADRARLEGGEPQADAAVARERGTVCTVSVADCMPVLFAAEDGSAVGAAHAGWRGLCAGVLEATLEAMRVPPGKVAAWLGPAIGPRVYEVGDDVRAAFLGADATAQSAFLATRPGHWLLDLYAVARQRLRARGVTSFSGGEFCTYSDAERFFSYRRDGDARRMAAAIWLT